jgi:hypothetical protein
VSWATYDENFESEKTNKSEERIVGEQEIERS